MLTDLIALIEGEQPHILLQEASAAELKLPGGQWDSTLCYSLASPGKSIPNTQNLVKKKHEKHPGVQVCSEVCTPLTRGTMIPEQP